jgi:hypothetical protein
METFCPMVNTRIVETIKKIVSQNINRLMKFSAVIEWLLTRKFMYYTMIISKTSVLIINEVLLNNLDCL